MAFDWTYPSDLPSSKGWGKGWSPTDLTCSSIRTRIKPHSIFQGGVHEDIYELVDLIVKEARRRGYVFHRGWSWGFACRATKGGDGNTPSFHSWGLALDVNAPENPFASDGMERSDIAQNNRWLVVLFREYGFMWLGPSIGDTMHFHFAGDPADAKAMTAKARSKFLKVGFHFGGKTYKSKRAASRAVRRSLKDARVGATRTIKVVARG